MKKALISLYLHLFGKLTTIKIGSGERTLEATLLKRGKYFRLIRIRFNDAPVGLYPFARTFDWRIHTIDDSPHYDYLR